MDNFELVIRKLLGSPAFASILAILAFYYSWYLFQKTKRRETFCVLTMTPPSQNDETKFIILNNCDKTVQRTDFASKDPLRIIANNGIEIRKIELLQVPSHANDIFLTFDKFSKELKIDFEFLRKDEGLYFKIFHNSSRIPDLTWKDFKILGTFKHKNIYKRDFTDQMILSANRANMYSLLLSTLYAVVLTVFTRIILIDIGLDLSFGIYVFFGAFFLTCAYFIVNRVLNKVGHIEYVKMWNIIKDYEKNKPTTKIIYDYKLIDNPIKIKKIKKSKKNKRK